MGSGPGALTVINVSKNKAANKFYPVLTELLKNSNR